MKRSWTAMAVAICGDFRRYQVAMITATHFKATPVPSYSLFRLLT